MMYRLTFLMIAIGLACFPSLEYRVLLVDGPDTEFYGFPLPWNSRFIAGSMAKDIYVLPLLLDGVFFLAGGFWLWRWLEPRLSLLKSPMRRSAVAVIWAYGLYFGMGALIVVLAVDLFPSAWYDLPISEVVSIHLHTSL